MEGVIFVEIVNLLFFGWLLKYFVLFGIKMYDKSRDIYKIVIFGIRCNFIVRKSKNGWKFYVVGKVVLYFIFRRM